MSLKQVPLMPCKDINEWVQTHRVTHGDYLYAEHVMCADGFLMSVQASKDHYSMPQTDDAPLYTHFEVGAVSKQEPMLEKYADKSAGKARNLWVYLCVPAETVDAIISKHGGYVR